MAEIQAFLLSGVFCGRRKQGGSDGLSECALPGQRGKRSIQPVLAAAA